MFIVICIPECIVFIFSLNVCMILREVKVVIVFFHLLYVLKSNQIYLPSIISLTTKIGFFPFITIFFIYHRIPLKMAWYFSQLAILQVQLSS